MVARDHSWQVDLLPLGGETIEDDLAGRDLTVNAIAQPLSGDGFVDPFGGLEDLRLGRLRMVSVEAFQGDPLRVLRLARLASELRFVPEPETMAVAARSAPGLRVVAPERVFLELKRIVTSDRALEGLELMDELAATEVILPELASLHGIEQSQLPPPRRVRPHPGGPEGDDLARARSRRGVRGARAGDNRTYSTNRSPTS